MRLATTIISGVKDRCRECGACIRICPVKAVKITESQAEIIEEKCIHCGQCLNVCSPKAIVLRQDVKQTKELLTRHQVVAIVSPELAGAFPEFSPNQLESILLSLGFYGVEESILGEELVAQAYLSHIRNNPKQPIIRSTCRAVVELVEKYYPDLIPYMAPIVSPMVAQGRLIKSLYPEGIKTVFIGPCVAKKAEIEEVNNRPIDIVLTFGELKTLLEDIDIAKKALESDTLLYERPLLMRSLSVSEGFPREILTNQSMIDNSLVVGWGIDRARRLIASLSPSELISRLFDLMGCTGCIDGPGMETQLALTQRKLAAAKYLRQRSINGVFFEQLETSLPPVDLTKNFSPKKVTVVSPTVEELEGILKEGGKESAADELNCGSCGYDTCREKAVAIYQGLADWTMCFPRQKQLFLQTTSQLREISATDGLTGLMNHRAFLEKLKEEFNRVVRYQSPLSLIMIDVDRFKTINDTYGHLEGDRVLKLISNLLRHNLRETDIAARYGGDEFAIILPQTHKTEAFAVAEKLRRMTEESVFFVGDKEKGEKITLSLGVCVMHTNDTDPLTVIAKADKAMYQAKESGRNQTIIA